MHYTDVAEPQIDCVVVNVWWMISYNIHCVNACNVTATTTNACTCSDASTFLFLVVTDLLLPMWL